MFSGRNDWWMAAATAWAPPLPRLEGVKWLGLEGMSPGRAKAEVRKAIVRGPEVPAGRPRKASGAGKAPATEDALGDADWFHS